jgi:hypothetical protein
VFDVKNKGGDSRVKPPILLLQVKYTKKQILLAIYCAPYSGFSARILIGAANFGAQAKCKCTAKSAVMQ